MFNIKLKMIDELYLIYYKLSIINYIKNLIQLDIEEKFINNENIKSIRTETLNFLLSEENECILKFRDIMKNIDKSFADK